MRGMIYTARDGRDARGLFGISVLSAEAFDLIRETRSVKIDASTGFSGRRLEKGARFGDLQGSHVFHAMAYDHEAVLDDQGVSVCC